MKRPVSRIGQSDHASALAFEGMLVHGGGDGGVNLATGIQASAQTPRQA